MAQWRGLWVTGIWTEFRPWSCQSLPHPDPVQCPRAVWEGAQLLTYLSICPPPNTAQHGDTAREAEKEGDRWKLWIATLETRSLEVFAGSQNAEHGNWGLCTQKGNEGFSKRVLESTQPITPQITYLAPFNIIFQQTAGLFQGERQSQRNHHGT